MNEKLRKKLESLIEGEFLKDERLMQEAYEAMSYWWEQQIHEYPMSESETFRIAMIKLSKRLG